MNILITGASGLIGKRLTEMLLQQGESVAHLGRGKSKDPRVVSFQWDPAQGKLDEEAVRWADAIINLAGAPVADQRWTDKRKKEIIDSRVQGLRLLADAVKRNQKPLRTLVSASAIGWYGMVTEDKIFKESDPPSRDFFGECCSQWEAAADLLEETGARVVKLRIGIVLAKEGGALPQLAGPIKAFIGSPLGSGKQWMPWIHIDDVCEMFLKALRDEKMSGAYNAAGPQPVTNKTFVKTLGKALHRPVFFPPVPKFILRMLLGERAAIVTEGSRVSNEKIVVAGFVYRHSDLLEALRDLYAINIEN